ncbi:MAG: DUF262 domain-containing protein [Candidatus Methanoperedens sp.]|nr:DUF262 domain-containing protein [Candidatus Methanoperedens sp.]
MHADAVPLNKILDSNLQMIIPIFQREYSWEKEQVKTLWEDIIKVYKSSEKNGKEPIHFLGPIVRVEVSTSSVDTRKLWLIDGQQRMITLMVLLSCLRNALKDKDEAVVRKIESGYLLNYQEEGENRNKLVPSEGDRDNFRKIIIGQKDLTAGKLKDTFDLLTKKIENNKDVDFEKLRGIVINRLILVNIDVDKHENPYLIFESLNAKGTPLAPADLIRNYIFMKIPGEEKQKELYKEYWRPMESSLVNELNGFFWRYSLKDGTFVKWDRTYANLKTELETNTEKNAEDELKKLFEYSLFYRKLISPDEEKNEELRKRHNRHKKWEIGTAYPFLLNVYKDYSNNKISSDQFCEILDIIESFVVRRFFCKEKTNKLNTLFIGLHVKIDKNDFIGSLKSNLLKENWPNNEKFIEGLKTFPIYTSGTNKCRLVLDSLEISDGHKEQVDLNNEKISIEHIMPEADNNSEKLSNEWKNMLGQNYREVHNKYLHTIGNLTLTGYNQQLFTKPFEEKREILKESHFQLNRYFENLSKWDEQELLKRAEVLSQKAIHIWKHPEVEKWFT